MPLREKLIRQVWKDCEGRISTFEGDPEWREPKPLRRVPFLSLAVVCTWWSRQKYGKVRRVGWIDLVRVLTGLRDVEPWRVREMVNATTQKDLCLG